MPLTQIPIPDRPLHAWGILRKRAFGCSILWGLMTPRCLCCGSTICRTVNRHEPECTCTCATKRTRYMWTSFSALWTDGQRRHLLSVSKKRSGRKASGLHCRHSPSGFNAVPATGPGDCRGRPFLPDGRPSRETGNLNPFTIVVSQKDKDAYRESSSGRTPLQGQIHRGKQQYFAATIEDEVVGWPVGKSFQAPSSIALHRVVVHPTYRGCGVGTALVQRYLEEHPDCDTVASMARFNPVFEKAGMRRVGDVLISPPASLKAEIPLTQLEWASKQKCAELMAEQKWREKVAPFASTQFVNPGGTLNGSANRKQACSGSGAGK